MCAVNNGRTGNERTSKEIFVHSWDWRVLITSESARHLRIFLYYMSGSILRFLTRAGVHTRFSAWTYMIVVFICLLLQRRRLFFFLAHLHFHCTSFQRWVSGDMNDCGCNVSEQSSGESVELIMSGMDKCTEIGLLKYWFTGNLVYEFKEWFVIIRLIDDGSGSRWIIN